MMQARVQGKAAAVPPTKLKALGPLYWSLVGTTLLAAMLFVATFLLGARSQSEDEWVRHTLAVRNQFSRISSQLQRAESGERGFLLPAQAASLATYDAAAALLPPTLEATAKLVIDNLRQQQGVARLRQLVADKLRELQITIDERIAGHADVA